MTDLQAQGSSYWETKKQNRKGSSGLKARAQHLQAVSFQSKKQHG